VRQLSYAKSIPKGHPKGIKPDTSFRGSNGEDTITGHVYLTFLYGFDGFICAYCASDAESNEQATVEAYRYPVFKRLWRNGMIHPNRPWIQSLLLVSSRTSSREDLSTFRDTVIRESRMSDHINIVETVTMENEDQHFRVKTLSRGLSASGGILVSELCRDRPYWPFTSMPFSQSFNIPGNGVAVHSFPILIPFQIYCIVCGKKQEEIDFSWEIIDSSRNEFSRTILTSPQKRLVMLPLTVFPKKYLKQCLILDWR
jgi:hypothetical protein